MGGSSEVEKESLKSFTRVCLTNNKDMLNDRNLCTQGETNEQL